MIEIWYPPEIPPSKESPTSGGGEAQDQEDQGLIGEDLLGGEFSVGEFINKYLAECEQWDEEPVGSSILRQRVKYLYDKGYLARKYIGATEWMICPSGIEVSLTNRKRTEPNNVPDPSFAPLPLDSDPEPDPEDQFLAALKKHGYLK